MKDIQKTLEFIVDNYSTFDNYILHLKNVKEVNTKLIHEEKDREHRKEAWDNATQSAYILESLDILLGNVKLEDLKAAARTLAPKMQSSFGE